MNTGSAIVAGAGTRDPRAVRKSRWPARLDWMQSASGLLLALFMWGHMFFVSSILLGKDAMWTVTRFFEGYFLFGRSYPWIVSMVVAAVIVASRRALDARAAQVPHRLRASTARSATTRAR